VQPEIVLRAEAAAAPDLVHESPRAEMDRNSRANGAAVRTDPFELHDQGMPIRLSAVDEQARRVVHVVHDDVLPP
jgi:hypothetical protein